MRKQIPRRPFDFAQGRRGAQGLGMTVGGRGLLAADFVDGLDLFAAIEPDVDDLVAAD